MNEMKSYSVNFYMLRAVSNKRAYVLGSSIGAAIALFFIQYEAPMVDRYHIDFEALKASMLRTKILIRQGSTSPINSISYLGAQGLSEHLALQTINFPGNHAGMNTEFEKFAMRICELFLGRGV